LKRKKIKLKKINMKKIFSSVTIVLFILASCSDSAGKNESTLNDSIPKANKKVEKKISSSYQSNIQIPNFKDPEVQAYFDWYAANIESTLKAVRRNDKAAIKANFDESVTKIDEATIIVNKARNSGAEELKKVEDFTLQITPLMKEVGASPYFQLLTQEYLAKLKSTDKQ